VYYLVFRTDDGRWHWSLCDDRHRTVKADAGGYAQRQACLDAFADDLAARGGAEVVPVVELERQAAARGAGPNGFVLVSGRAL
jgi:hypothetical protein